MSAATRRLTPEEHTDIEGGFIDWFEMFPRPVQPEHVALILAAHQDGASIPSIADALKLSPDAVAHVVTCNTPGARCVPVATSFGRGARSEPATNDAASRGALGVLFGLAVMVGTALGFVLVDLIRWAVR